METESRKGIGNIRQRQQMYIRWSGMQDGHHLEGTSESSLEIKSEGVGCADIWERRVQAEKY